VAVGTEGEPAELEAFAEHAPLGRAVGREDHNPIAVVIEVVAGDDQLPVPASAAPEPALDGGGAQALRRPDPERAGTAVVGPDRPAPQPGAAEGV
jgi:hypothetical protein